MTAAPPPRRPQVEFVVDPRVGPDRALMLLKDQHGNVVHSRALHPDSVVGAVTGLFDPAGVGMGRNPPVPLPPADQAQHQRWRMRDVPELRDGLLEMLRSGLLHQVLRMHEGQLNFPHHPGTGRQWTVEEYVPWLTDRLAEAELFYVTADMSTVVRQAAAAAPFYQIEQDQQPARVGFVVFGDSICSITDQNATDGKVLPGERSEITAALWAWVDDCGLGEPGVLVVTWQDADVQLATRIARGGVKTSEQLRGDLGPLGYHDEAAMPFGTRPFGLAPQRLTNEYLAAIQSMWIMMTQRITVETREPLSRQQRKQYAQAGRPPPAVRSVTLRRAAPDKQHRKPGESGRTYTRRWVVGEYAYWRNTWYPRKGEHRQQLVLVPSYVKGPEGAPLVGGERVNTLRR